MAQNKEKSNIIILLWNNSNFFVWLILFALLMLCVYALRSILTPFVLGILLGYLFDPLATKLEGLKISRTSATVLTFIILLLFIVPLILLLTGVLDSQIRLLMKALPSYVSSLQAKLEPILIRLQEYFPSLKPENIKTFIFDNMPKTMALSSKIFKSLVHGSVAFINVLSLLVITPVVAFYMLKDWNIFIQKADNLLPLKSKKQIEDILLQIDRALSGFIRGQVGVCLILGTYYALALKLVGLDLGILVGFIAGIISFIPYIGSITGFVLSLILAFSQFNNVGPVIAVVSVFLIGQFIEGNFLTPKLVGDKVGLHPVWVMFSLLAGGVLFGFLGLMVAVPVAAVIGILIRHSLKIYQKSTLYLGN